MIEIDYEEDDTNEISWHNELLIQLYDDITIRYWIKLITDWLITVDYVNYWIDIAKVTMFKQKYYHPNCLQKINRNGGVKYGQTF